MSRASNTITQVFRDWSADGAAERNACYAPVLRQLDVEFGNVADQAKGNVKVLIPGAGLGRLVVEVLGAGYSAEGNEISYHMILASNFILHGEYEEQKQYSIYPFATSFSNHLSREDQFRRVMVPDLQPAELVAEASASGRMTMSASDFCVTYKEAENREKFDAVATVFFIDTAPNLLEYIAAVKNALKKGGIWINNGPLTWHFEDDDPHDAAQNKSDRKSGSQGIGEPGSFELTEDEVRVLVERSEFAIEKHETFTSGYSSNDRSMLLHIYRPVFWVARKL
jgi:carnosine N-methyltransferase